GAGILDVGVVELEPFVEAFAGKVELRPGEIRQALRVDEHDDALAIEAMVLGGPFFRVPELVRETGAAGGAHAETEPDALAALGDMRRDVLCGARSERD